MPAPNPYLDYPNIRGVSSFAELLQTPFEGRVNALCWPRLLDGNFAEVVEALGRTNEGVICFDEQTLASLVLTKEGKRAVDVMLTDLQHLRDQGLEPELNRIGEYPRDTSVVSTDVYSFHIDQAPIETDTWLCTYYGPPSEGLRNEHAQRCVELADIRAMLLQEFGGAESAEFEAFLEEHSYHLHYKPMSTAKPWSFGVGHLWRIAAWWPGCPVPACIHRAPVDLSGQPRLLLIS